MILTRTISTAAIAGILALSIAGAVQAQGGGGRGGPLGMLGRMDADSDGKVSAAEYDTGRADQFKRMDANTDGSLTFAEIDAFYAERMAQGGGNPNMQAMMQKRIDSLKAADANGDKAISADENKAAATADFKALDTNADGFVTAEEVQASMPPRP